MGIVTLASWTPSSEGNLLTFPTDGNCNPGPLDPFFECYDSAMRKQRLFTPGPTPLMPAAQNALASPLIHHRTPAFAVLLLETRERLQRIFRSDNDVVVLASSGTGAMEAAVASVLRAKLDRALIVATGKFGERWIDLCRVHGIPQDLLEKPYGQAPHSREIADRMLETGATALLVQGCETSTATQLDLESIGRDVRARVPESLIIVDAITALATQPLESQAWELDVVISGSQKSFAMSPGLAFMCLSPRALAAAQRAGTASYYFDLAREVLRQRDGQTAFTPAISLVQALHAAAGEILEQGLERVIQEAELMAAATRAGLQALGFRLLSSAPANAVTAAFPPSGIEVGTLIRSLESRFGVKVGGGQGELKGKILRIAHLGYFDTLDVFSILAALEICVSEHLIAREATGAGVATAMEVVRDQEATIRDQGVAT